MRLRNRPWAAGELEACPYYIKDFAQNHGRWHEAFANGNPIWLELGCPMVAESPLSLECKVVQTLHLGSHDMFLADIVAVDVDPKYVDEKGALHMEKAGLLAYAHGAYFGLGKQLGTFGFSVRKKPLKKSRKPAKKK